MRLFLLPISTRRALIYCQRLHEKPITDLSLVQKTINKVPQTWAKWETAESGWKKSLTQYGNRGLQRIPYQEWGLKSFPPLNDQIQAEELSQNEKFDVIYPGNVVRREDVPKIMRRLASEHKQLHWRRFIWSLVGIPFAIPFGLVPV
jgi:Mitochondrial K+-H+ exchange-related